MLSCLVSAVLFCPVLSCLVLLSRNTKMNLICTRKKRFILFNLTTHAHKFSIYPRVHAKLQESLRRTYQDYDQLRKLSAGISHGAQGNWRCKVTMGSDNSHALLKEVVTESSHHTSGGFWPTRQKMFQRVLLQSRRQKYQRTRVPL